jgi:amino acid transporter
MLFLMPYIVLVFAFAKLRKIDAQVERPFRVPFGHTFASILAWFMALILIMTIILFIWVPGYPIDWGYTIPVLAGVIISLIAGEIIVSRTMKQA